MIGRWARQGFGRFGAKRRKVRAETPFRIFSLLLDIDLEGVDYLLRLWVISGQRIDQAFNSSLC